MDQIRDTDFNLFRFPFPRIMTLFLSLSLLDKGVNMLADPCLIPPVNLMSIFNWKWFDSREKRGNILRFSLFFFLFFRILYGGC